MRHFFLEQLEALPDHEWLVISGATGAGKTSLLQEVTRPKLDLEKIACHRGSAFGALGHVQPSQATFENEMAAELLRLSRSAPESPWLVEDESRMIGARVMPEKIFLALRISPIVLIEDDLDTRVENTFTEYVMETDLSGRAGEEKAKAKLQEYELAVQKISPKLGGLRTQEILSLLHSAKEPGDHRAWIRKLLQEYYDPFYFNSIKQRGPQVVFRGSREQVRDFLLG
jgi:tRNA 2-selenouridine synthase